MARLRDGPAKRLAFEKVRRAANQYGANLRKIARHIGDLTKMFDPTDQSAMHALTLLLKRYSDTLRPWASAAAMNMLNEVSRRDTKAWETYARQMGRAIERELRQAQTGLLLREALARQVELITSLPLDAAQRVHELTQEGLSGSKRPAEIAEAILATGDITASRAMLIARTEVARTASEFTQARATSVGSTHYIWRGVKDRRERDSHLAMEGRIIAWAEPPEVEPGKRYHAGCIYNCRCYPEPIVPED